MKTVKRTLAKAWIYQGKTYGPGDADLPEDVDTALGEKGAFAKVTPVTMSAADPKASAAGPVPPAQLAPLPAPVTMPSINPPPPDLSPSVPVPPVGTEPTNGATPTPPATGAPSEEAASSVGSAAGAPGDSSVPPAPDATGSEPPAAPARRTVGRRRTQEGDEGDDGKGEE